MKACIFTKTKFSVYAPGSRAWRASQLKEADYMDYLFDEERLSFRWHIFKHFSVPTLIKNHEFLDTFFSIIYYSEELPNKWKDKLFSLESKYSFIKVCRDDTGKDREFIKDSLLNNSEQQNNRTTEQQNNRTTEQQNNRTTEQQNNRTTEQQNNRTTEQQNNRTAQRGGVLYRKVG